MFVKPIIALILIILLLKINILGTGTYRHSIYDRSVPNLYSKTIGCNKNTHRENLYTVDKILKKHNIDYNLSDGTALGALRENDIIEGDGDVDLEIDITKVEKFKNVIPDFKKENFRISRFWINSLKNGQRINLISLYRNYHYVDFQFSGYGKYCISISDNPPRLCDEFLTKEKPYQYAKIGDREFKIPSTKYIELLYGDDWKIPKKNFKPENIKRV